MFGPILKETPWAHAESRYQCVTPGLIEELQIAFLTGQDFKQVSLRVGLDYEEASLIVAETLRADCTIKRFYKMSLLNQLPNELVKTKPSDFEMATMAELALEIVEEANSASRKESAEWFAIAYALLETIANSPTASPMLWYEDIFVDLSEAAKSFDSQKALQFLKRGLVHNLRYNDGDNAFNFLQDIADWHIQCKEVDRGLEIFIALLQQKPDDIWIYNELALSCQNAQLNDLSTRAAQRGLELLKAKGDPDQLSLQLKQIIKETQRQKNPAHNAVQITPSILEDMNMALNLDFDTASSRPLEILCRELVPDIDTMPVKRPLTYLDLPLPDRNLILKELLEPLPESEETIEPIQQTNTAQKRGIKSKKKHRKH